MFRNRAALPATGLLALAALGLLTAGCGKKPAPPPPPKPVAQGPAAVPGVMVYTSQGKLWRMSRGATPEALSDRPVWFPAINAETTQAAYWEDDGGEMALVVMNLISRTTVTVGRWRTLGALGRSMNLHNAPSWLPGRDALVFADGRQIWQVEADGSNLQTLYEHTDGECYSVTVSPDGSKLGFISVSEKEQNLWVFSQATKLAAAVTEYTHRDGQVGSPSWSPRNDFIVFTLYKAEETNLWRIPPEGGSALQVTREGRAGTPSWDITGKKIVVSSATVNPLVRQIHLISADDGKYLEQLTNNPAGAYAPAIAGSW